MESVPELSLTLANEQGEPVTAPVSAVSWGELRASFPTETAPVLLIGQSIELRLRGERLGGLARVRGFVSQRVEDEDQRTYAFQIDHGDSAALDDAVNRRATLRVTPEASAPIRLVIQSQAGRAAGLLRDVSEGGLSFLAGREEEWLLAGTGAVQIEFRLPGSPAPLRLAAEIRHRRLERTAIHYGVRFLGPLEASEDPVGLIRAYVAARGAAMKARLASGDAA